MASSTGSTPTLGVEEEFLLVDPSTGAPVALNRAVAERAARDGVELQLELTSCQVETASSVVENTSDLRDELLRLRTVAAGAAEAAGAQLLAVGLPPTLPSQFPVTDTPRYRDIGERFGMIAHEQGICGCHVHVAVPDRDAAIGVSNRLRPWLPLLLALTANSAIYRNADTGHASWRSVLWARWPSAGPPPQFASADEYDAAVEMLCHSGVIRDDGMVYWDVRPSRNFPTIEVRVADAANRCNRWRRSRSRPPTGRPPATVSSATVSTCRSMPPLPPGSCWSNWSSGSVPRSNRLVTTSWSLPAWPEWLNGATARCVSRRRGGAATRSPTCWPRLPRRRWRVLAER